MPDLNHPRESRTIATVHANGKPTSTPIIAVSLPERALTIPAACPTPRWCSQRGPCQHRGCRYDDERDWVRPQMPETT